MSILIIGGMGYIGVALVDHLKSFYTDKQIVVIDSENYCGSVKKRNDVEYITTYFQSLPKQYFSQFSDIILLAGQGSVSNSKNILNVIDNNIRNFAWLLENITQEQKLIYASSSSIYGDTNNKEVDEEYSKINGYIPYNYYDWSKQTIDQLASLSNKHYYSLRFGTVNGFSRNLRSDVMINSMSYNAKNNGKIFVSNKDINRAILGINDLCRAIVTIINNGKKELSGFYNLNSFNSTVGKIAKAVSYKWNVPCEELNSEKTQKTINFKLQTNSYNFKIHSTKFTKTFNFHFKDTLDSIIYELIKNWSNIENFENRLIDNFVPYHIIEKCRICNTNTQPLLNLGKQPLANNYIKTLNTTEDKYPLYLHYCENCYHTQLNCVVLPEKLFKNYVYTSGTSRTLKEYFKQFALQTLSKLDKTEIKILDIACNDGSQLDMFYECTDKKLTTVGVDPAENIYKNISSHKTKHNIYCEFFNKKTATKLFEKHGHFDIIIAQNVFAHVDNPGEFLQNAKQLMNNDSYLYIQTSQKNMILENQFDTAYHEHLSFFSAKSMKILCDKNDIALCNIYENEIHGTSYIFEIKTHPIDNSNIDTVLQNEYKFGLYNTDTYKKYNLQCLRYKNNFYNKILEYKLQNKQIIAFGSTAKSMTLLNFCNITNEYIDFMIDENPLKQNLYTPGSQILVQSLSNVSYLSQECVILITAWNFYKEIKEKIECKLKQIKNTSKIILLNIESLEEEIIS